MKKLSIGNLNKQKEKEGAAVEAAPSNFRLIALILILLFASAGAVALWLNPQWVERVQGQLGEDMQVTQQTEEFTVPMRLGVFAKFSTMPKDLNLGNISDYQVYISSGLNNSLTAEEKSSLEQLLRLEEEIAVFPGEEINDLNSSDYADNALVIDHFSNADMRVKAMNINGVHLYSDQEYPLILNVKRQVTYEYLGEDNRLDLMEAAITAEKKLLADELDIQPSSLEFTPEMGERVFFGGEIIPTRAVDRLFLNRTDNYTFLFDRFREDMVNADLTVSILENPLYGNPTPCTGCTVFVSDARNAKGFSEVGIDMLGFGNHAGDGGFDAVVETEKLLAEHNVGFTGLSSENLDDASRLVKAEVGDQTWGFIAADDVAWFYWAGENRWGTNRFSQRQNGIVVVDEQRIKNVISEAEKEVDYLVVLMSWGIEYRNIANQHQQRMAHLMMDNGADLIVASHPHWVQNLEIYTPEVGPNKGEKLPIFYSLGNFIFDQTHTDPTRQGIVVNAYYYENQLKSFEIIPHLTCGYHQSNNNLANQVISGEMTYEQVDAMDERDGCIYWQPKPLEQTRQEYKEIWDRFMEGTEI